VRGIFTIKAEVLLLLFLATVNRGMSLANVKLYSSPRCFLWFICLREGGRAKRVKGSQQQVLTTHSRVNRIFPYLLLYLFHSFINTKQLVLYLFCLNMM
jgi:hypothetical protein